MLGLALGSAMIVNPASAKLTVADVKTHIRVVVQPPASPAGCKGQFRFTFWISTDDNVNDYEIGFVDALGHLVSSTWGEKIYKYKADGSYWYIVEKVLPLSANAEAKRPFKFQVYYKPFGSSLAYEKSFDPAEVGVKPDGRDLDACVTLDMLGKNDSPFAFDDAASVAEDAPTTIDILVNDFDPDGDPLDITTTAPKLGVVLVDGATVTYTPNANVHGADSFNYTITDPSGLSSAAKVDITVTPVNDAPVAADDVTTVDEDSEITINVLANDSDAEGDALVVEAISTPANGARKNQGNTVWYKPKKDFNGVDTFRYRVVDGNGGAAPGNVTVTVNPVNDAPKAGDDAAATTVGVAVTVNALANDSDIDGDQLVIEAVNKPANGSARHDGTAVTYTPRAGFAGTDTLRYRISDGKGGKNHGDVTVTVSPQ